MLLATQPPICLDPSTDVVCFTNRLQYNQRKFHTPAIRRTLRKRSHARRARMHMTSEGVAPRGLQLHDFIAERTKSQPRERWREVSQIWKLSSFLLDNDIIAIRTCTSSKRIEFIVCNYGRLKYSFINFSE